MRMPGRWLLLTLALPLILAALRLTDAEPPPLQDLETQTLTLRYRLRGPLKPSGAVSLVMIDDRTLAEYGRWPLSRRLIAQAVRRLTADGARVVAVSRASPTLTPNWPKPWRHRPARSSASPSNSIRSGRFPAACPRP
jgi:CHASE2 domain-containing sensor protein